MGLGIRFRVGFLLGRLAVVFQQPSPTLPPNEDKSHGRGVRGQPLQVSPSAGSGQLQAYDETNPRVVHDVPDRCHIEAGFTVCESPGSSQRGGTASGLYLGRGHVGPGDLNTVCRWGRYGSPASTATQDRYREHSMMASQGRNRKAYKADMYTSSDLVSQRWGAYLYSLGVPDRIPRPAISITTMPILTERCTGIFLQTSNSGKVKPWRRAPRRWQEPPQKEEECLTLGPRSSWPDGAAGTPTHGGTPYFGITVQDSHHQRSTLWVTQGADERRMLSARANIRYGIAIPPRLWGLYTEHVLTLQNHMVRQVGHLGAPPAFYPG